MKLKNMFPDFVFHAGSYNLRHGCHITTFDHQRHSTLNQYLTSI